MNYKPCYEIIITPLDIFVVDCDQKVIRPFLNIVFDAKQRLPICIKVLE